MPTTKQATIRSRRRKELEQIRRRHGGTLNPTDVVEFARNADTALHSAFTWDDGKAADEYRLWQARQVIRVYVEVHDEAADPVRTYVSLLDDRGDVGYRATVDVLTDTDMRNALLEQARRDMVVFQRKYAGLKTLAPVFAAMRKVGSGGGNGRRRIAAATA